MQLFEYGTSVTETYSQSITAWNVDAHDILIPANYMAFDDHTEVSIWPIYKINGTLLGL